MATDKQIAFITALAAKAGLSVIEAVNEYGLGLRTARDLSIGEASELIDFMTGKPHRATIAPAVVLAKPVKTAPNKGGRVGASVATKSGLCAVVISDSGKRVQVQFKDGSKAGYAPADLTFV